MVGQQRIVRGLHVQAQSLELTGTQIGDLLRFTCATHATPETNNAGENKVKAKKQQHDIVISWLLPVRTRSQE